MSGLPAARTPPPPSTQPPGAPLQPLCEAPDGHATGRVPAGASSWASTECALALRRRPVRVVECSVMEEPHARPPRNVVALANAVTLLGEPAVSDQLELALALHDATGAWARELRHVRARWIRELGGGPREPERGRAQLPADLSSTLAAVRVLGTSAPATRETMELLEAAHAALSVAVQRVRAALEQEARELHRQL